MILPFSLDLLRSLLWQYDDAPNLRSLAESKQRWYEENVAGFWTDWFRDVFDLRTANSFGLAIWAIILDLPLTFYIPPSGADPFGFEPAGNNFDNSNFGAESASTTALTVEQRRLALRLRYFQLTSNGTVPSINAFLAALFPEGRAYVVDDHDMTCRFIFEFLPDPLLFSVITDLDLLPRPAGVKSYVLTRTPGGTTFGFDPYYKPFDQGNFTVD